MNFDTTLVFNNAIWLIPYHRYEDLVDEQITKLGYTFVKFNCSIVGHLWTVYSQPFHCLLLAALLLPTVLEVLSVEVYASHWSESDPTRPLFFTVHESITNMAYLFCYYLQFI